MARSNPLPNLLSGLRILLGLGFLFMLIRGSLAIALVLFILAMFTDIADGYVARKLDAVSRAGIILDGVADKIILALAFLFLTLLHDFPAWAGWIIVGYHAYTVLALGYMYARTKNVPEHSPLAKALGALQTATVIAALTAPPDHLWVLGFAAVTAGFAVITAAHYQYLGAKTLRWI